MVEPDQETRNQKQHSTKRNQPEVDLLAAIEEADILSLNPVGVRRVLLDPFDPTAIGAGPLHRHKPVQKLEKKKQIEKQAEPGMQQTSSRAATKQRRQPAIQPRRINREAGDQR